MLAADFGTGEALSTIFVAGLFGLWLLMLVLLVGDMFADPELSGPAKAGWLLLMLVLPLIGIFIYLVMRGDRVGRRMGAAEAVNRVTRT